MRSEGSRLVRTPTLSLPHKEGWNARLIPRDSLPVTRMRALHDDGEGRGGGDVQILARETRVRRGYFTGTTR